MTVGGRESVTLQSLTLCERMTCGAVRVSLAQAELLRSAAMLVCCCRTFAILICIVFALGGKLAGY